MLDYPFIKRGGVGVVAMTTPLTIAAMKVAKVFSNLDCGYYFFSSSSPICERLMISSARGLITFIGRRLIFID